jgi:hypothetical protein
MHGWLPVVASKSFACMFCLLHGQVLARAITKGCADPINDYLKMNNRKKVVIRDIDPKSVSTQELYGFVNMATREWKVSSDGR